MLFAQALNYANICLVRCTIYSMAPRLEISTDTGSHEDTTFSVPHCIAGSIADGTQLVKGGAPKLFPVSGEAVIETDQCKVFSDGLQPRVWDTTLGRELAPWLLVPQLRDPWQTNVFEGISFLDANSPAFMELVEVCRPLLSALF